jgi:hypothetical protein
MIEPERDRELRLFKIQFQKAGLADAGDALERWVETGDEAARDVAIAAAPLAAEAAEPDWARPLFFAREDDPWIDRLFVIALAGFEEPSAWLTWATNSIRLTGRFTAAIRYLQRRAGLEVKTPSFPWTELGHYPPAALYFPVLDALLDVVAIAQPELLPHAKQRALSCFFGAADLLARDEYAKILAGRAPLPTAEEPLSPATEPVRETLEYCAGVVALWIDANLDPKRTLDGKGGPIGWFDHDDWEIVRGKPEVAMTKLSHAASFAPAAIARATELGLTGEAKIDALFGQRLVGTPGEKAYGWFLGNFPYTR